MDKRRKISTSIALSPWASEYVDQWKELGFTGMSDLVQQALTEHRIHAEMREYKDKLMQVYEALLKTDTGRDLLKAIPKTQESKIQALKEKGMAHVELGELNEAMKCFEEAKKLEENKEDIYERKTVYE